MWGFFFLGIAIGIIICEVCEGLSKKAQNRIKEIENELLLVEINKLKEQIEKQN
tara:strand:- start:2443 stop:2604 length:162 start_codon:yes stop_codon:yes gene_type:complete